MSGGSERHGPDRLRDTSLSTRRAPQHVPQRETRLCPLADRVKRRDVVYNRERQTWFSSGCRESGHPMQQFPGVVSDSKLRSGLVREAIAEGQSVQASAGSPEEAICPACGGAVRKRKRRAMDGQVT